MYSFSTPDLKSRQEECQWSSPFFFSTSIPSPPRFLASPFLAEMAKQETSTIVLFRSHFQSPEGLKVEWQHYSYCLPSSNSLPMLCYLFNSWKMFTNILKYSSGDIKPSKTCVARYSSKYNLSFKNWSMDTLSHGIYIVWWLHNHRISNITRRSYICGNQLLSENSVVL